MAEFRLTIRLGNAEMQSNEHIAEALREAADKLDNNAGPAEPGHAVSIFDINGNRVGQYKIVRSA